MTPTTSRHFWAVDTADGMADGGIAPAPHLDVRCHRRLRGPYTAGGTLMRLVVPDLMELNPEIVAAHTTEIVAVAPELASIVPAPPQTLTNQADLQERTRFYAVARTLRIAHGLAEVAMEWARRRHPDGAVIALRGLDEADPTDRELARVLLRRCDHAVTVVAECGDDLDGVLATHARRVARRPEVATPLPPHADLADLADLYIASDCTDQDPDLRRAYSDLAPQERARRHTARAEALAALGEPTLRRGAIPFHQACGVDPSGAGVDAFVTAIDDCMAEGFYEAALDLCLRGRELFAGSERPKTYWSFTTKAGACLSYLDRGEEAIGYFAEMRRGTHDGNVHMASNYGMAMLYTRHLPKAGHDEDLALAWANGAIALADRHPDPKKRVFVGAFMRNARALVELHRGDLKGSLALVEEAIAMTDADLDPDEQLLHRSVLLYNRAQILFALGDMEGGLADYDEVIRRDPDYGDYYFERAAKRRAAGRLTEALQDYSEAIRLSPPFREAHFNRADLLRELGDEKGALRDLDYALELEPDHVDSLVNRVDVLLALGETEQARTDIRRGLELSPHNAQLLCAEGTLLADEGDLDAAFASYTAAIQEDPGFVALWANRAVLSYSAGRIQDAVADLNHAIRLSDDPALRANRALALQDLGDHEQALKDLDIAVPALAAHDPDLLYRRGASRYELGDTEGALADWRAHLAAFTPGQSSEHITEIRQRAGDSLNVPEGAA